MGFGAIAGGGAGGRTAGGEAERKGGDGARKLVAGAPGGRLGRLMRGASFPTGTVGRCGARGGNVIRTVSFFGSFKSAMEFKPRILRARLREQIDYASRS
jgi:hypothetical protein